MRDEDTLILEQLYMEMTDDIFKAAKSNGYTIGPVYRGDRAGKNKFTGYEDSSVYLKGSIFFSSEPSIAKFYTKYRTNYMIKPNQLSIEDGFYSVLLKPINPIEVDANGEDWMNIPIPPELFDERYDNECDTIQVDDLAQRARKAGYGMLIVRNMWDQAGGGDQYAVFDSSQIKLADTVTYDDKGNPIPLEQRFNSNNPDIRY